VALYLIEFLVVVLALGCGGCSERAATGLEQADASSRSGSPVPVQPQIQPQASRLLELAGEVDTENRYPSVAIVRTLAQLEEAQPGQCGGVIIAPQLILTAAHCVCTARKGNEGISVFDSSACEKIAFATTVGPKSVNGSPTRSWTEDYRGTVRPHPEFKLVLDSQGRVTSSVANLAVILLQEPVASEFPSAPLADTEVQLNELVMTVSYGHDEVIGGRYGERRFSKARVTQIPGSGGRALFDQPGQHAYKGESGGAVLREGEQKPALLGILSRSLGEEPSFTSAYPYRGWLNDEIQNAIRESAVRPQHAP
jgi:hypothetical protein